MIREVNAFDQYKIRRITHTKKHKAEQLVNIWKKKIHPNMTL